MQASRSLRTFASGASGYRRVRAFARFTGVVVIAFEVPAIERAEFAEKQRADRVLVDPLRALADSSRLRPEHSWTIS